MDWVEIFTNVGSTGVMAWICWYMISKSMPGMLASFREEMVDQRKHMTENLQAIRLESKQERSAFQLAITNLSERFDEGLEKQRQDYKDEMAEHRETVNRLADKIDALRDAA